jgi:hypothetical protein
MHRIIHENLTKIIQICTHRNVRKLSVYGSATNDRFDPERSDLDLLVEFERCNRWNIQDTTSGLGS